jgi:hypothetical protein
MSASPSQPPPQSARAKPPKSIHVIGRRHQWATYIFLSAGFAAFALAWWLGYVHFD